LEPVTLTGSDIAFLHYPGGTTGVANGAVLTHQNLLANQQQLSLWLRSAFERQTEPEVLHVLGAQPLYHISALTVNS
ncbi:AMP-binding protein, partial [Rhizobium ruizarguesonis]